MAARQRQLSGVVALVVLGLVTVGLSLALRGDSWVTWHDYGRWTISEDRTAIRTERSALGCTTEYRAQMVDSQAGSVLLRFEQRPSSDPCPAVGCVSVEVFDCGVTIALPKSLPAGATVHALCEPERSFYATTVPGGGRPTLTTPPDQSSPIVCSPDPEGAD